MARLVRKGGIEMKLGQVLKKEREKKRLSMEMAASSLGISVENYQEFEAGTSPIEEWGPKLAQIAIKLSVPTSRLISQTGKSTQAAQIDGQCGQLISQRREKRQLSQEAFAQQMGLSVDELQSIERGETPLETYAPHLLRFAELVDQPIFNLFYPCGLPFQQLNDYP